MKKIQIIAGMLCSMIVLYISLSYYFAEKCRFFCQRISSKTQKTNIDFECREAEADCIKSISNDIAKSNEINITFPAGK